MFPVENILSVYLFIGQFVIFHLIKCLFVVLNHVCCSLTIKKSLWGKKPQLYNRSIWTMIPYIWDVWKRETERNRKHTCGSLGLGVALTASKFKGILRGDENILKWGCHDHCTTLSAWLESLSLQWLKFIACKWYLRRAAKTTPKSTLEPKVNNHEVWWRVHPFFCGYISWKSSTGLPRDPAIPLLDVHPKGLKIGAQMSVCISSCGYLALKQLPVGEGRCIVEASIRRGSGIRV